VVVSDQILHEVERILQQKFQWPEHRARQARLDILDFAVHVMPDERLEAVEEDPDDNCILECALTGRSDYLISGDNHLLRLGSFKNIPIVKVTDFLERTQAGQETWGTATAMRPPCAKDSLEVRSGSYWYPRADCAGLLGNSRVVASEFAEDYRV